MTESQQPRWRILLAVALIVAVGLLAYANNYQNGWHFDDQSYIVQNSTIRSLDNFKEMWHNLSAPARVVVLYSFALNWHFGQDDVTGYHIVNNLIHVITAGFVFGLVWLLLDTPAMQGTRLARRRWWVALFAGLIFVSHPLQTQAVTYICQRFASMATMFYAAGLFFYLRARLQPRGGAGFFVLAGLAAVVGMFSKQIVITLPVAVLIVEWLFFRSFSSRDGQRWRVPWKVMIPVVAFLLIIPSLYSFRVGGILSIKHKSSGSYRGELINNQTYPLTQLRVIPTYMRLLVLPVQQNLLYDFRISKSLTEPKTFGGLVLILACIGLGFACRRKYPLFAFGLFWFFLTVSVESSFIPIRHVVFEHRVYLPSIGFAILVAGLVFQFVRRPQQATALLSVMVVTLGVMTWERNKIWRDEFTLWEDVKAKSPHKMRPYLNTGIAHSEQGNFEQAIADFQIALEKVPNSIMALNNLGVTYTKMRRYDEALAAYDKALAINPKWEEVWNNRGDVFRHRKQYAEALKNYNRALEINDRMFRTLSNRGVVLAHLGRDEEALGDFQLSLKIAPGICGGPSEPGQFAGKDAPLQRSGGRFFDCHRRYAERAGDLQ